MCAIAQAACSNDRIRYWIDALARTPAPTRDIVRRVCAETCVRLWAAAQMERVPRIERLVRAGAWVDAALLVIELDRPGWHLRRLLYEDGCWHCRLSRRPCLPDAIDDAVDASHASLPLAIMIAALEAQRRDAEAPAACPPPRAAAANSPPEAAQAVCCDDFS